VEELWRPSANIEMLRQRALLLRQLREFFYSRNYLEVETPLLSHAVNPDPNIDSFVVNGTDTGLFLHTSPEFPMKRLLAAGSGSIFQICKVFRKGEYGQRHNPEFTMVEWYRQGYTYRQLMDEIDELLQQICNFKTSKKLTYVQLFKTYTGLDIFHSSVVEMRLLLENKGCFFSDNIDNDIDTWRDLVMTHLIEPQIGFEQPMFVYDYPATQSALAIISPNDANLAQRFELYIKGKEIANGYQELLDADEQQRRFQAQLDIRQKRGESGLPLDQNLVEALAASEIAATSGVALGLDRLMMVLHDIETMPEVVSFDFVRA